MAPWLQLAVYAMDSRRKSIKLRERDESYNRDGHWTRDFHARSDCWPFVEQWATDRGYHLVAMRGKRRLYRKTTSPSLYSTFLDIKEREAGRGMVLVAWIEVGFLARALSGFWLPSNLEIEPSGFRGIWKRREACKDLNLLLGRFRQLEIRGSGGIHFADMDPTTALFLAFLLVPVAIYTGLGGTQIELGLGLSNGLLAALASRLRPFFYTAAGLLVVHHVVVSRLRTWLAKGLSLGISGLVLTVLSIVLLSRSSTEMAMQKVTYHCAFRYQESKCQQALNELTPRQRAQFVEHMKQLQEQFGIAITVPQPPPTSQPIY